MHVLQLGMLNRYVLHKQRYRTENDHASVVFHECERDDLGSGLDLESRAYRGTAGLEIRERVGTSSANSTNKSTRH